MRMSWLYLALRSERHGAWAGQRARMASERRQQPERSSATTRVLLFVGVAARGTRKGAQGEGG